MLYANAMMMYKQKVENNRTAGYVKSALEYKALERMCDEYIKRNHLTNSKNRAIIGTNS